MNFIGVSIFPVAHQKVLRRDSSVHCRSTLWHMSDTFHTVTAQTVQSHAA